MSSNGKPTFAMYWAAGCGGCEIAVLNIHEKILDVDANFDIAFWPVAMDAKTKDVQALPDGAILLTLMNGGIRTDENEEMAHLLRRKSRILVAFGSCAMEGCIPGLANLSARREILDTAFDRPSSDATRDVRPAMRTQVPEGELTLPALQPVVRTLDQVVPVDYYMPGCPPESHRIAEVVDLVIAVIKGRATLPPPGSVIGAGDSTVCDDCARRRSEKRISKFTRIQHVTWIDPEVCLLEQGIPCNGVATRQGCGALCPAAGAPCIGCYGPAPGSGDHGARLISAYASVIEANDPAGIERILDGIPDPAGQFYRFNLAGSLLGASRHARTGAHVEPGEA